MEYVLIDGDDGSARGHYASLLDVQRTLQYFESERPGAARSLYMLVYGDGGEVLHDESRRGDRLLPPPTQAFDLMTWFKNEIAVIEDGGRPAETESGYDNPNWIAV